MCVPLILCDLNTMLVNPIYISKKSQAVCLTLLSGRQDSNLRQPGPKPGTLPTALRPVCNPF